MINMWRSYSVPVDQIHLYRKAAFCELMRLEYRCTASENFQRPLTAPRRRRCALFALKKHITDLINSSNNSSSSWRSAVMSEYQSIPLIGPYWPNEPGWRCTSICTQYVRTSQPQRRPWCWAIREDHGQTRSRVRHTMCSCGMSCFLGAAAAIIGRLSVAPNTIVAVHAIIKH